MRFGGMLGMVGAMLSTAALAQNVEIPDRRAVVVENVDFYGGDLEPRFDTTFETCLNLCISDAACEAFTFNTKSSACFPKSGYDEARRFDGALSARIVSLPDATVTRMETRAAELDFLPSRYIDEAHRFVRRMGVEFPANDRSFDALVAYARTANPDRAARLYAAALNIEDAPDVWGDLSRTLLSVDANGYRERRVLREQASAAAVNGYLRAETPSQQASALNQIATVLEARGEGRRMIDALRLSLSLAKRRDTEAALDEAIEKYGFRIIEHTVDSNAANPRLCMTFSEDLKEGVEYAPYVQLDRRDLPVEAEGRQLCVDGVEHGARYAVTARKGLPAASGEVLNRSVDLEIYVRDRQPSVRFTGRAYVLPKSARATIPVVTVNLDEVALRIHRVGSRNLRALSQRKMLHGALDGYQEGEIERDLGVPVWEGTGEVSRRLNEDVTTALPIGDAVTAFEPGVYAMTARTDGQKSWEDAATQWFVVTDLGLTTLSGADGVTVFVRSLASAEPMADAEVELVAANNEVLGKVATDADGMARFAPGLARGEGGMAPAMLTVEGAEGDFAFLDLSEAGFDLSDRGVEGRAAPGPIDIFLTTERGAYRPGETVHATILARDERAMAVADLPLTAILTRPDGVEYARRVLAGEGAGGRALSVDLSRGVPRGSWEMAIHTDPDRPALTSESFLVEDFTPERIDFDLAIEAETIRLSDVPQLALSARYLYGAPAGDLPISGSVRVSASEGYEDHPGYRFGLADQRVDARVEGLPEGLMTDAKGNASVPLSLPQMEGVTSPLKMAAILRVRDGSGRPVERVLERALMPAGPMIGIKPLFDETVEQGGLARFEVIGVDRDLALADMKAVGWEISRLDTRYQWYEVGGSWRYEPTTRRERIASGDIDLTVVGPVTVEAPVDWGRYELKLIATEGEYTASSTRFTAGWYAPVAGSDTPDTLQVSLDKERYAIGDTAKLRVEARFPGKVFVAVMDNRLIDTQAVAVEAGETVIEVPVTDDWGPGAYLTATLIRPMDIEAGRNPSRAIGVQWAEVDMVDRRLDVRFDVPEKASPRGPLEARIEIANLPDGETAYATIAAVDVGVLNITGFEAPEPTGHYFGQRRLGVEMRDLYGRLIDGSLGTLGRIRSGGDTAASGKNAPPPNEDVLAFFSGVIEVAEDGTASAAFDLPDFNGTVKLMAVVWSDAGVGDAAQDVIVADPVVVSASVPRFLAPGDESRVLIELAHAEGPTGEITVDLGSDEGLEIGKTTHRLTLTDRAELLIPVTARTVGDHELRIVTTTPDGKALTKTVRLPVRANDPETLRRTVIPLAAAGGTLTVDAGTFDGFRTGTGRATLALGPLARFDVPGLLRDLDRYPYGCTEQTTSRAFPLLYFNDVAAAMGIGETEDIAERVAKAVRKVLTNQSGTGGFGLWRASSGDTWLDAYVTDFLSQARTKGYAVPDEAMETALSNLRNRIAYAGDFERGGDALAYAMLVLAREGRASIGNLRYFADARSGSLTTPLAKAQLGGALAAYGEQQRADRLFRLASAQIETAQATKAVWRDDYGSHLRDAAAVLALGVEAGSDAVNREVLADQISPLGQSYRRTSTQEKVWTLLAAHALAGDAADGITVDGSAVTGPLVRVFDRETIGARTVVVENTGEDRVEAVLTTFGVPSEPPIAGGNGFEIERRYYTLEGEEVTPDAVAQNDRLVAVLTVNATDAPAGRLMVDDPLPAGFEIDNPSLLRAGEIAGLDWLSVRNAEMTEFRSDRFLAAVDARDGERFELAYIVRAVSPGRFYHPAASVEDMYRPELRANTDAGQVEVIGAVK